MEAVGQEMRARGNAMDFSSNLNKELFGPFVGTETRKENIINKTMHGPTWKPTFYVLILGPARSENTGKFLLRNLAALASIVTLNMELCWIGSQLWWHLLAGENFLQFSDLNSYKSILCYK